MERAERRLIFHIDVNSAFLSWSAVEKLKNGDARDLREIPAAISGDMASRHGVVLAKSIPAKAFGISTGEPVAHALQKCPQLVLEPPDHELYRSYSRRLMELLASFCPRLEQVSIDECFLDLTGSRERFPNPVAAAASLKDAVREAFGFTVNVGISSNKLLAKMASDFEKPDKTHTLFPEEIPLKMWPLPVRPVHGREIRGRDAGEAGDPHDRRPRPHGPEDPRKPYEKPRQADLELCERPG